MQLQGACGLPVASAGSTEVTLTSTSGSLGFFGDGACLGVPSQWLIPPGSSTLDVFFRDSAQGTPTLTVSSAGFDSGTQVATINCPGGEKPCGSNCIPQENCCQDVECDDGGVAYVCSAGSCVPPPCTGFTNGCTTYVDRTASNASRTITFDSINGYVPDCIRVSSGQSVTFSGFFGTHPLRQTCGPNLNMFRNSGTSHAFTMSGFNTWGYECANHPIFENGAIRVP